MIFLLISFISFILTIFLLKKKTHDNNQIEQNLHWSDICLMPVSTPKLTCIGVVLVFNAVGHVHGSIVIVDDWFPQRQLQSKPYRGLDISLRICWNEDWFVSQLRDGIERCRMPQHVQSQSRKRSLNCSFFCSHVILFSSLFFSFFSLSVV